MAQSEIEKAIEEVRLKKQELLANLGERKKRLAGLKESMGVIEREIRNYERELKDADARLRRIMPR